MISSYKKPDFFKQKGRSSDLFLLIVEGEKTELFYFEKLKAIRGRESNIRIKTETTSGGDIDAMLRLARAKIKESKNRKNILNAPFKKVYIIIDRDRFLNSQIPGIGLKPLQNAINSISKNKEKIEIIISAPCFEYWYLLHFCKQRPCGQTKLFKLLNKHLKSKNILSSNHSYSKKEADTKRMLEKFFQETDISIAISNSKSVTTQYVSNGEDRLDRDPCTEVHKLIEELELDKTK